MTKVQKKVEISKERSKTFLNVPERSETLSYRFKSRRRNPEYDPAKLVPLRSCHIHNKASVIKREKFISNVPKWLTVLEKETVCIDTGEIIYDDYATDDFKAARSRKIKTVNKFCDFYQPLYAKRKVSVLFFTFTRMDYSKKDMRTMLECVKTRFKFLGMPIRGYLWCLEAEPNARMLSKHHVHYHLVIAIDRVQVKEIPKAWKVDDLWGQRTGVEFIKKTVRNYLSKYLYKGDVRVLGCRTYAISRKLL